MIFNLAMIVFILLSLATIYHSIYLLTFFQQEEYDNVRLLKWSIRKWRKINRLIELAGVPLLFFAEFTGNLMFFVISISILLITFIIEIKNIHRDKVSLVKPLIYTSRAKRILITTSLLIFGLFTLILWSKGSPISIEKVTINVIWILLLGQLTVIFLIMANTILMPVEWMVQTYYIYTAQKKLRSINPVVIGVTGSFGKTTTKELIFHILSKRYRVLKTPKSYNTIMGICKVIREELKPSHQYFVIEMGAYKPGEIRKICNLVQPKYGVLTAIGSQHLERFKTIENVVKAKSELMQALPKDGYAIYNGDDPLCDELSRVITNNRVLRYGLLSSPSLDITANNLVFDGTGTSFEVSLRDGNQHHAHMALLGSHNDSNALAAILLAGKLGFSLNETINYLRTAEPPDHRLKIIQAQRDIIYIDDSYNSNPIGAKIALDVLSLFNGKRKILVTPGFVELGAIEEMEHEKFGFQAGRICDYIFLIGDLNRTQQIMKGIKISNMKLENVIRYNSFSEANKHLRSIVRSGDVVLIENDLPDLYQ